ncbi:threonylcarbamoyl-AMP synthase [archaeon BMS3Abin16]|nr:threonylcarbamoyl-AMP synthase [archaeon BMS3Abin16]HDY73663.1 threonylcarbamoyl-AMP synthase [Euryarchaeota archaeon]
MGALIQCCSDEAIKAAGQIIRDGGLVVYPTDTLYGLGCSALDEEAVQRVFEVKKRDPTNPLSIAVCNLRMLRRYTSFDSQAMRVMECFLPGPVTFVLRKKALPDVLTGGGGSVGVRIPESRVALKLIMEVGVPIVSTSANISGQAPPETADEVMAQLPEVDLILDGGKIAGRGSTIIDLTTCPPRILREGAKPAWEVAAVIEEVYQ